MARSTTQRPPWPNGKLERPSEIGEGSVKEPTIKHPTRKDSKAYGKQKDSRPSLPERSDTAHSRYVEMLLGQDEIPKFHNILAAFFVWLLLAGFLVFPGSFTSLQEKIEDGSSGDWQDDAAEAIVHGVKNIPLVVIGAVACGVSAAGMIFLAYKHVRNYVWLLNRLFLPGATNSLAGLISTLVGVYSQQDGAWNVVAKVTAIVEGSCLLVCGGLFLVFERYLLRKVKTTHDTFYTQNENHDGEGLVEKLERKAKEPGMEPGSVV